MEKLAPVASALFGLGGDVQRTQGMTAKKQFAFDLGQCAAGAKR
jgi:hypothetical protein